MENNYIISFFEFLRTEAAVPTAYGTFHLISFALTIACAVLLCVFFRDCNNITMRFILLSVWIVLVALELLEQFVIGTTVLESGALSFSYQWYRFPFQLCSTSLWILPFIILLPPGRVRNGLMGYIALFSFAAGLIVMLYPGDVFNYPIITNVHTMVHHGSQVALGIFFMVHERKKYNMRYFVGGVLTFVALLAIACVLNEVVHETFLAYGYDPVPTFNMFYVSPYHPCTLPVLSEIYKIVPYPVFLAIYTLGFSLIGFIVYFVVGLINYLVDKGELSPARAARHPQRNIIMKAIGIESTVLPDVQTKSIPEGACIMLVSDGLYSEARPSEIKRILGSKKSIEEKTETLVKLANRRGGHDNITVVLAEI